MQKPISEETAAFIRRAVLALLERGEANEDDPTIQDLLILCGDPRKADHMLNDPPIATVRS